jgi:hypothetical protein
VSSFQEHFQYKYVVSDHLLIENGTFDENASKSKMLCKRLNKGALDNFFENINTPTFHTKLLGVCLVVNFVCATKSLFDYQTAVETYGHHRIYEFFGQEGSDEGNRKLDKYLQDELFPQAKHWTKDKIPESTEQFICNLPFGLDTPRQSTRNKTPRAVIGANGIDIQLEGSDEFKEESLNLLRTHVSKKGIQGLIYGLLEAKPGTSIPIPAGRKDGKRKSLDESLTKGAKRSKPIETMPEIQIEYNCVKKSLQLFSQSPNERVRIEKILPDYEIGIDVVNSLLEKWVKTIQVGSALEGDDLLNLAMTEKEPMLAIHYPKECCHKHCILIDGSDGEMGTISDPVDEGHGTRLPRNETTLEKLRVGKIIELRKIHKFELSDRKKQMFNRNKSFKERAIQF